MERMTMDLALRRQFFAEEIAAVADLKTPGLIEALQSVPRERFLRAGPWLVRSDGDFGQPRATPDGDVRHVYHNYSIAIDIERHLFNGAPGLVASWIDVLQLTRGAHVLHVGAGLGYYSALMAHTVGPAGRVVAIEIDPVLASEARGNLASAGHVEVRMDDGSAALDQPFDAILVSAGVTHPQRAWLEALKPGGRLVMALTASMPAMGALGKGFASLFTKDRRDVFQARVLGMTIISSALGLRDEGLNRQLGQAMMGTPFPRFTLLRIDEHAPSASCWLHADHFCLATNDGPSRP
jgi:protein-L-isoaspartate(D-aspartate) O-methyltransferase